MKKLFLIIIAPLIVAIVGGVGVFLINRSLEPNKPALTIDSSTDGVKITNNTERVLRVRTGYAVVDRQGRTFCYPEPTAADEGQKDPKLLPRETRLFPPGKCGNSFDDFALWAWDSDGKLVFTNKP
jgi:hypothetical protein